MVSPQLVRWDGGHVLVDSETADVLRHLGLTTVARVMAWTAGQVMRDVPNRITIQLTAPGPDGPPCRFYLKRHRTVGVWTWLGALARGRSISPPGPAEAAAIRRLQAEGIPTPRVVATGCRWHGPWRVDSFLITEELPHAMPLDDLLRNEFAGDGDAERTRRKRALLGRVADLVRRFHRAGYNHRDLYCCHIFVGRGPDRPLWLIDLQRVEHRRWWRRRWLVKDVAQLAYSAPPEAVSKTDRIRFLKKLLEVDKLRSVDKRFARRVLRKVNRIRAHDQKPRRRETERR